MAHEQQVSSPPAFPTTDSGYDLLAKIGVGAFATVFAAKVNEGRSKNKLVAIKILELDDEETNWDEIRKEISVMKNLDHPNVVRSYCSFISDVSLWLVMPLLAGGSCADLLKMAFKEGFDDEVLVASILKETLQGLDYFHQDGKIHRDIKAGNILLAGDGGVKIGDFGVSGALVDVGLKREVRKTFTGTPCWMAPEVMEQAKGHNYKADIWSFGITALELAYGRPPYAKYRPMKVMLMILQEDPPSTSLYDSPTKFSSDFKKMVDACLKKDPKERPGAQKLLSMKFFRKAKGKDYIKKKLSPFFPEHAKSSTKPPTPSGANKSDKLDAEKQKPVSVSSFVFDEDAKQTYSESSPSTKPSPAKETATRGNGSANKLAPPGPTPKKSPGLKEKRKSERRGRFLVEDIDLYGDTDVPPKSKQNGRFHVSRDTS